MRCLPTQPEPCGATLIEAVIAIGVLAVAIPMVFGTIADAGKSAMASQAETRSTWMIPTCMEEIRASREGHPQYFTATANGQTFPPAGEVWALAFSADGKPVGKLTKAIFDKGAKELDGKTIRYIATMSSATVTSASGATPMLRVDISLQYPASAPAAKRAKLDFHTRVP